MGIVSREDLWGLGLLSREEAELQQGTFGL